MVHSTISLPKICVWCPPFLEWSGGALALHRLVHELSVLGEVSYAVGCHKNDKWQGGLITENNIRQFLLDNPTAIMVYPETVQGNPYGAKNVVRWLLNNPAVTIGESPDYPDTELLFTFCEYYSGVYKGRIAGQLGVMDLRIDSYIDKGQHIKGKTCYTIRKGYTKTLDKHAADAILIRDYQEQQTGEELIKIFDECETFISYDHNCFLSVHAALRGCISIVIPDAGYSKEKWRKKAGFMKYGIAYGFDDKEYAINTRHLIKDYLRGCELQSIKQINEFINICHERFK